MRYDDVSAYIHSMPPSNSGFSFIVAEGFSNGPFGSARVSTVFRFFYLYVKAEQQQKCEYIAHINRTKFDVYFVYILCNLHSGVVRQLIFVSFFSRYSNSIDYIPTRNLFSQPLPLISCSLTYSLSISLALSLSLVLLHRTSNLSDRN